jgi:hypothetical protein
MNEKRARCDRTFQSVNYTFWLNKAFVTLGHFYPNPIFAGKRVITLPPWGRGPEETPLS